MLLRAKLLSGNGSGPEDAQSAEAAICQFRRTEDRNGQPTQGDSRIAPRTEPLDSRTERDVPRSDAQRIQNQETLRRNQVTTHLINDARMKIQRPSRDAMTLIEVLLVVAIMAILAGLAIPNANPSTVEQLRSAASIVSADLAYARSQAVTYGSEFRVTFDMDVGQYEIEHVGANAALDDVLQNPFDPESSSTGRYVVSFAELPSLGAQVGVVAMFTLDASGEPQSEVNDLTFGPLGETGRSQDTRVWLAVGSGSSSKTISVHVNAVTGLATVEPPGKHALPEVAATEPSMDSGP
jgi:prepilin-type N-terminal cleavage/methylation domain-containing protein